MLIPRYLHIDKELQPGKTLVLFGPRRVGKTTLLIDYINHTPEAVALYRGDELSTQAALSVPDSVHLAPYIGSASVLAIDEAQAIPGIGQTLKVVNDALPEIAVVVTGSSSFELAGQIGEPLTGRKTTRYLFPVSVGELLTGDPVPQRAFEQQLQSLLIYGMYPNVLTAADDHQRAAFLRELIDSYLLRDILTYRDVKGARVLVQLLSLLAHQVGQEASLSELGNALGLDKNTIARYLDLLEKSYIVFRLGGFSRNLRSEVTRTAKYYFYDIGVRNAVINNFNPLELRSDVGQLWENFMITERLKLRTYSQLYANQYFWRTWKQSEIDLVEERDGQLFGYEMKWKTKNTGPPTEWHQTYGVAAQWQVVNPQTALAFLNAG